MADSTLPYLTYSPSVEQPQAGEQTVFDDLSRTMQHITRTMASRYRHAYRPVHAKSHGLLVGTLEVLPGLAPELAQGLFARPAEYPVIMRFSTNPGDMLADDVSSPRGLAIKILNVPGQQVANSADGSTQEFVCINANAFTAPDPQGFLEQIKTFDKNLETPEGVKHAVSVAARATNAVLIAVHLPSATLEGIGAAATHILGESFSTVAPLRYGGYVAKLGFAPGSENLRELTGKSIDLGSDYNALELLIKEFFETQIGVWDVRVQLALAPEDPTMDELTRTSRSSVQTKSGLRRRARGRPLHVLRSSRKTRTRMHARFLSTRNCLSVRGIRSKLTGHSEASCERG